MVSRASNRHSLSVACTHKIALCKATDRRRRGASHSPFLVQAGPGHTDTNVCPERTRSAKNTSHFGKDVWGSRAAQQTLAQAQATSAAKPSHLDACLLQGFGTRVACSPRAPGGAAATQGVQSCPQRCTRDCHRWQAEQCGKRLLGIGRRWEDTGYLLSEVGSRDYGRGRPSEEGYHSDAGHPHTSEPNNGEGGDG